MKPPSHAAFDPALEFAPQSGADPGAAAPEEWISIGRIMRPRGRIGELLAILDSDKPDRAEQLGRVRLRATPAQGPVREQELELEQVWSHDGRPVLKFRGIDSISDAELWAGAEILVPASDRVELDEGEFFFEDLAGCELVGPDGAALATVASVEEYGGPPLLRAITQDGRELLVPFARAICTDIDVAHKRIRVELPDGLIDL